MPPTRSPSRWVETELSATDLTYGKLRRDSARFAAALADLGIGPGDAVATLMGKSADLALALLGIWRRGAVYVPLFTGHPGGIRMPGSDAGGRRPHRGSTEIDSECHQRVHSLINAV
ncbi:AMP-binding protein [Streptomyces dysideae]|uniref:AMP-binding protein n=1 Tax=Streptomyces dysideae TaxID=909626 RepID=UPI001F4123D3|nr:AMP-binding protein [Streptomyces dysideae]